MADKKPFPKPTSEWELHVSRTGSILGYNRTTGVIRKGAHFYEVPSRSIAGTHHVYVESLNPINVYRCSCTKFLMNGHCHHGQSAIDFEYYIYTTHSNEFAQELKRRAENRAKESHL